MSVTKHCSRCDTDKLDVDFYKSVSVCITCTLESRKAYYEKNKEAVLRRRRQYVADKRHAAARAKRIDHFRMMDRLNSKKNQPARTRYMRERRRRDKVFAVACNLRRRIADIIKKQGFTKRSILTVVLGCDWDQLKRHIEQQFQEGMTWENHGAWHVDHKTPVSRATTIDELELLNHFSNLQPLWAQDNIRKSNKHDATGLTRPI